MRSRTHSFTIGLLCGALALGLPSCTALGQRSQPSPAAPTPTLFAPTAAPTVPTLPPPPPAPAPVASDWQLAAPGIELRTLEARAGELRTDVHVARIDPALVRFRVGYAPETPRFLGDWASQTGALAVINGGFFDEQGRSVALLISAGQPSSRSYEGRGGMFAVDAAGQVSLRALSDQPYDPAEPLTEALQGWPLLVRSSGAPAYTFEDGERARRSALALDSTGHALLIVAPGTTLTLAEFSTWLAAADLDITRAVNLDGGSSTGLVVRGERVTEQIEPFVPVPITLLVLPR